MDSTLAIGCEFLVAYIDGTADDLVTFPDFMAACGDPSGPMGTINAAEVTALASALGDKDGTLERTDFAEIDLDANQVTDEGAWFSDELYVFTFVDDDERVTFDAEDGALVHVNDDGGPDEATPADDGNSESCDGDDDADCGTTSLNGDGVVIATIEETTDIDDDTNDVDVFQADNPTISVEVISVQGPPDEVGIIAIEDVIGTSTDADACAEDADILNMDEQIGDIEKTVVIAIVFDSDGDELTRIPVTFEAGGAIVIDETESFEPTESFDTGISVDFGAAGIAAFAVVCGDELPGTGTVTARINIGSPGEEDATTFITVAGVPAAVALTASPATIDCNGVSSSTVTAIVTDAQGNPVADGTNVNFNVVAFGTANPINAVTIDGAASSVITPAVEAGTGVTVIVTADAQAQAQIRINCAGAATTTSTATATATTTATATAGSPTPTRTRTPAPSKTPTASATSAPSATATATTAPSGARGSATPVPTATRAVGVLGGARLVGPDTGSGGNAANISRDQSSNRRRYAGAIVAALTFVVGSAIALRSRTQA